MSFTDIIVIASIWLIAGILGYYLRTYVLPWLLEHNLYEAATVAVEAAEAVFGRYNGEQKLKSALEQLENNGWDIHSDMVINAVKSAWERLNIRQIQAGVKEVTVADDGTF